MNQTDTSVLCLRRQQVKRVSDETQKLLQSVQIQSDSVRTSDICFLHEILFLSGFLPFSLTGLLHVLNKSLCRPPSLFLLNSRLFYSDESLFHYLPRRLRPPRCFLQHIEELVHKSPESRASRKDYSVGRDADRGRQRRGKRVIYASFFQGVPVSLWHHQKKQRKRGRMCLCVRDVEVQ